MLGIHDLGPSVQETAGDGLFFVYKMVGANGFKEEKWSSTIQVQYI